MKQNRVDKKIKQDIVKYFNEGMSVSEIGELIGFDRRTISYHLDLLGIKKIKKMVLVVDNPEKVKIVLDAYKNGMSLFKICKEFNIRDKHVKTILINNGIEYKNKPIYRKHSIKENIFNKIDTQEKAYWLGMLFADGCVTKYEKKGDHNSLELSLKDKEHVKKFIEFLGETKEPKEKKIGPYISYRYYVSSKELVADLIEKGCTPKKSLTLTFPKEDVLPTDLRRHFIRGYFDGDGSITVKFGKRDYYISSLLGTEEFLEDVQEILLQENVINKKTSYRKHGKAYGFQKSGRQQLLKIKKYLYPNETTIYLERKFKIFCRLEAKDRIVAR